MSGTQRIARKTSAALVLALAGLWTALPGATAGEEVAAPVRPVGVVKIEQVFEQYKYRVDRQRLIDEELRPRLAELEQVRGKLEALETEIIGLRRNVREDHPTVVAKQFEHRQLELELQKLGSAGEERQRELLVQMYSDVYKYFNAACRNTGKDYGFGVIITAIDDKLPDVATAGENVKVTPYMIMTQIMTRNVQYTHPHWDITAFITHELNEKYGQYETARRAGNNTAPIYPTAP